MLRGDGGEPPPAASMGRRWDSILTPASAEGVRHITHPLAFPPKGIGILDRRPRSAESVCHTVRESSWRDGKAVCQRTFALPC
jgi:hypothetical protein